MRIYSSIISICFLAALPVVYSFACGEADNGPLMFVQNDGQWDDHIEYRMDLKASSRLYLEKDKLTYVMSSVEDINEMHYRVHGQGDQSQSLKMRFHAFSMKMVGANDEVEVSASCEIPFYHNYFIGDNEERWKSNVPLHQQVDYSNVYDGIDMSVFGMDLGVKYEFLVEAGADPAQIVLSYEGADGISVVDGRLKVQTSVGDIYEGKPYVFQQSGGQQIEVACNFQVDDNRVSFHFPDGYDEELDLIIDPELIFASYTGSVADNWGYSATYDDEGFFYGGGIVFGTEYPASLGAFQIEWAGGEGETFQGYGIDISIFKWSPDGVDRIYASFLGGSGNEIPHSMVVNSSDELIVYGSSSSSDFPTTDACFDDSFNGGTYTLFTNVLEYLNGSDIVLSRFSADGSQLEASTYIGGTGSDGLNGGSNPEMLSAAHYNYGDHARGEILVDSEDNIIVCSSSFSDDFPVTDDAIQPAHGGQIDGVVFKFNPGLDDLAWSTYLGGTSDDAAFGLELDSNDNVYVSGSTESPDFTTTAGVVNETALGGLDAFIAKISAEGNDLMAATFLGTEVYDQGFFLELDNDEEVYLVGQTLGDYPVEGDVFSTDDGTIFIQKMTNDLSAPIWSTRIGGTSGLLELVPTAFLVDRCEQIYLCGWGGSTNNNGPGDNTTLALMDGWPITNDAFKPDTDGSDFYLMILTREAEELLYGTYFGGTGTEFEEHVDGGTSRFDKDGIVYQAVCASCGIDNDNFPTTPGVWSQLDSTETRCNYGAFKFEFDLIEVIADFEYTSSCDNPLEISFINNSLNGSEYLWDFGDETSTDENPSYQFPGPGEYVVSLFVDDPVFCEDFDSTEQLLVISETIDATFEPQDFCVSDNPAALEPTVSGGAWSGDGIDEEGVFDPSIGVGQYEITYSFETDTCFAATSEIVNVFALPDAGFEGLEPPYCLGDAPVELIPNVPGGTFSGPGVEGNIFDPSEAGVAGATVLISYEIVEGDCSNVAVESAFIVATPIVELDSLQVCAGTESVVLDDLLGATLAGGTWTGESVTDGVFDSSELEAGSYEVSYELAAGECLGTGSTTIELLPLPEITADALECLTDGTTAFSLSITVVGPYEGFAFSSAETELLPSEADLESNSFSFLFTTEMIADLQVPGTTAIVLDMVASAGETSCEASLEFEIPDCPPCTPDAGTMPEGPEVVCAGKSVSYQTTGEFLDDGAELWYVLHDLEGDTIGNVYTANQSGEFLLSEIEGVEGNMSYYISPVVGYTDGTSYPDLNDDCTDWSVGTEVVTLYAVEFEVNALCDWTLGEYNMTVAVTGGLPLYESGETYNLTGFYSDDDLLPGQSFTIVIPSTDGTEVTFQAVDALGCEGEDSRTVICIKTAVDLLEFEGRAEPSHNLLSWATAQEFESSEFVLERLSEGEGFLPIARVQAAGNSELINTYEVIDAERVPDLAYYRLISVDINGSRDFSQIISVQRADNQENILSFWPNPAEDHLYMLSSNKKFSELKVLLFDQMGRKLLDTRCEPSAQAGIQQIDLGSLSSGLYLMTVESRGEVLGTHKLLIR